MAITTVSYGAKETIPIGLHATPLASSSTLVLGRSSAQVDNTTSKFLDAIVQGRVTTQTPTGATGQILVYVWGSDTAPSTTSFQGITGSDSDVTINSVGVRDAVFRLGAAVAVDTTTANRTYNIAPFSVATLFGGVMPRFWGLWVTQNTGAALNATAANHEFTYVGIKYDVT